MSGKMRVLFVTFLFCLLVMGLGGFFLGSIMAQDEVRSLKAAAAQLDEAHRNEVAAWKSLAVEYTVNRNVIKPFFKDGELLVPDHSSAENCGFDHFKVSFDHDLVTDLVCVNFDAQELAENRLILGLPERK